MRDEQDVAESLDADKIDDDARVDEDATTAYPPDRLLGANQYGVTPAEERWDEPLDERVSREEPEPLLEEIDRDVRRVRPTGLDPDDDPTLPGVLEGVDDLADDGELRADLSDDEADRWPEDRAMHVEREPD